MQVLNQGVALTENTTQENAMQDFLGILQNVKTKLRLSFDSDIYLSQTRLDKVISIIFNKE